MWVCAQLLLPHFLCSAVANYLILWAEVDPQLIKNNFPVVISTCQLVHQMTTRSIASNAREAPLLHGKKMINMCACCYKLMRINPVLQPYQISMH